MRHRKKKSGQKSSWALQTVMDGKVVDMCVRKTREEVFDVLKTIHKHGLDVYSPKAGSVFEFLIKPLDG